MAAQPNRPLPLADIWPGAAVTALLVAIGNFIVSSCIRPSGVNSSFGPAASVIVLLLWTYYSAQILLLGAHFTRVYGTHRRGSGMRLFDCSGPRRVERRATERRA